MIDNIHLTCSDCLPILKNTASGTVSMIYIDPPFFTQKKHTSSTKDGLKEYGFDDIWSSRDEYAIFLLERLSECRRVLKNDGSIFFHCDKTASHIARVTLDEVFGAENFQSEIIWHFKRWSNARKGLLPCHQNIYFYSKSREFKFNRIMQGYSETTNVDQILQKRARDSRNKSTYARDESGAIVEGGEKSGVPLSDVWDIPFLNPKARERVGYPTQKPVVLLRRIIELATDVGDTVLDPFCGSGTTLVAAAQLGRKAIGVDSSNDAIEITRQRLEDPISTTSKLMEVGRGAYKNHSSFAEHHLNGIECIPVQRNSGIDAIGKRKHGDRTVFFRVQREGETLHETIAKLKKATVQKGRSKLVVIETQRSLLGANAVSGVSVIRSAALAYEMILDEHFSDRARNDENSDGAYLHR